MLVLEVIHFLGLGVHYWAGFFIFGLSLYFLSLVSSKPQSKDSSSSESTTPSSDSSSKSVSHKKGGKKDQERLQKLFKKELKKKQKHPSSSGYTPEQESRITSRDDFGGFVKGHLSQSTSISFSSNGKFLATASAEDRGGLKIFPTDPTSPLKPLNVFNPTSAKFRAFEVSFTRGPSVTFLVKGAKLGLGLVEEETYGVFNLSIATDPEKKSQKIDCRQVGEFFLPRHGKENIVACELTIDSKFVISMDASKFVKLTALKNYEEASSASINQIHSSPKKKPASQKKTFLQKNLSPKKYLSPKKIPLSQKKYQSPKKRAYVTKEKKSEKLLLKTKGAGFRNLQGNKDWFC